MLDRSRDLSACSTAVKVGVLFIGRKRPGFDPEWGQEMTQRVRAALAKTGWSLYEPPEKVCDDASLRDAAASCLAAEVNAIVVLQTTVGDLRMTATLSQVWPLPIVLWATPENQQGDMVSSCSLVGLHAWASTLRQMHHPFEIVYGDPDDADTMKQLAEAVRLAATCKRLQSARMGVIGSHAPGYFAMAADPFSIKQGVGAQLQTFTLLEFADVVKGLDQDEVSADVARVKALGLRHKDTTDDDLPMASRLYLALRHYLDNEQVDALCFRCWPDMPSAFGQWPYLGMARLSDEGRAVACEGDADGALTALVGECLAMGPAHLSDWLEHDDAAITLWHGGNVPMSLSPPPDEPGGPRIARHFNSQKPAVVESTLRVGMPITICRLWRLDGKYLATARDAQTVAPRRHLMGSNGLARLVDGSPRQWFLDLCHAGMPHHVSVFEGHHTDLLHRFARTMQMQWVA